MGVMTGAGKKVANNLFGGKNGLNVACIPEERLSAANKCMEVACTTLNFNVAEIWEFVPRFSAHNNIDAETSGENIGGDTEAPICIHVYSRFDNLDRSKAVIVGPSRQMEKDERDQNGNIHKLSPEMCKMATAKGCQLWLNHSTISFDRGMDNPLSGQDVYDVAVAIPMTAKCLQTENKYCMVFFSVNTVKQYENVELFLDKLCLACILSLTTNVCGYESETEDDPPRASLNSELSLTDVDSPPPPLIRLPPFSTNLDWNSLTDIKHLVNGSKFTTFMAKYNGAPVVVKVVRKASRDMSAAIKGLESEQSLLLRCSHPHIITLVGSGVSPEIFEVVNIADGGTLSDWLKWGSPLCHPKSSGTGLNLLPLSTVLKFGRELADAMIYLTGGGISDETIIYGDLRPSNIGFYVQPCGEYALVLIDLGNAREIEMTDETAYHEAMLSIWDAKAMFKNSALKTPLISEYVAPEVAEMRMFDEKADVFSFAMVMWSLLTMEQPYADLDRDQFYAAVIRGNTRPPLPPNAPEELKSLLVLCWDEDPTRRPSFCDILDKLNSIDQTLGK